MKNLFTALLVMLLIVLIAGWKKPQRVLFWLDESKKTKRNLLIFMGIPCLICFMILGIIHKSDSIETNTNNANVTIQEEPKEEIKEESQTSKKEWKPEEVAKLNRPYYCYDDSIKYSDGRELVLNLLNVSKKDNNIDLISAAPPYDDIKYAQEKYMKFKIIDEEGNDLSSQIKNVTLSTVKYQENGDTYANSTQISISGVDVKKAKWITIQPYQTGNKNPLTYEIK